jgi:hypothetical protein
MLVGMLGMFGMLHRPVRKLLSPGGEDVRP